MVPKFFSQKKQKIVGEGSSSQGADLFHLIGLDFAGLNNKQGIITWRKGMFVWRGLLGLMLGGLTRTARFFSRIIIVRFFVSLFLSCTWKSFVNSMRTLYLWWEVLLLSKHG
ncbi:hypothetical protein RYX36_031848 [Vicia faba]